jgi:hypothetical protein
MADSRSEQRSFDDASKTVVAFVSLFFVAIGRRGAD